MQECLLACSPHHKPKPEFVSALSNGTLPYDAYIRVFLVAGRVKTGYTTPRFSKWSAFDPSPMFQILFLLFRYSLESGCLMR